MSITTKNKIESFNKSYGVLFTFIWRFIFYPILALVLYSASSYLKENYVSKSYFDASISKIETTAKEISNKLDTVIITNAAANQKDVEAERRLASLEGRIDRLGERIPSASLYPPPATAH